MYPRPLRCLYMIPLNQKINPIIQSSARIGRNTTKKTSFRTAVTPKKIDATRKNIPRNTIIGIRKMPNISLHITSDMELIGFSVRENLSLIINLYHIAHFSCIFLINGV